MPDFRKTLLIAGTYTHDLPHVAARGKGIHLLGFDGRTGTITSGPVIDGTANPSYLTTNRSATVLYAVQEVGEEDRATVDIYRLDVAAPILTRISRVSACGSAPCHISLDLAEKRLFISNYVSGSFVTYPLGGDGIPAGEGHRIQRYGSGPRRDRQEGAHVHQGIATPDGRHVLVCDAGADEVARYPLTGATIACEPDLVVKAEPGSMPRHLALICHGKSVAVVHELGGTVDLYCYEADALVRRASAPALPEGWAGEVSCAAIRAHPNGRFLYASNRGHDSIAGFAVPADGDSLKPLGWWHTGGRTPRDFIVTDDGRFLIVANQDSDNILVLAIDLATGGLTPVHEHKGIGTPACLHIVRHGRSD